jgi:hypothetical protein
VTYPARTIAGVEVQIAEKTTDPQRGDVLTDTDGIDYVQDYATGYLVPTDATVDAPAPAPAEEEDETETEETPDEETQTA